MFLRSTELFVAEMLSGECSKCVKNYKPNKDDPSWKKTGKGPRWSL